LSLLLPLTADDQLAEATIVVPGLDDGEHVLLHRIPGRPRVSDCAFYAMQKLARETKAPPLRLSVGASPGATREKPTKNSVALAWFKQAAPSLPPQRAPFPTPPDSP